MRVEALESQLDQAGDQRQKIDALNGLAWELVKLEPDRSIRLSNEASQLAKSGIYSDQPYLEGLADALCNISHVYIYQADYDKALNAAFEIINLLEGAPPSITLSRTYNNLAASYRILGNMSEALDNYFKQIQVSETINDNEGYASALVGLGTIKFDQGLYAEALEYFRKSRTVFEELGDTYWGALVLNNISYMHFQLKNYEHALLRGQESLEIARQFGHKRIEILATGTIGEIYDHMGEKDQALRYFKSSVKLARENENIEQEIDGLRLLANFYVARNQPDEAIEALKQSLPLAEKINHRHYLYQCHELLYQAYKMKGDTGRALSHHEQFFTIRETVFNEESNQKLRNLEVLYRTETAQKEAQFYASRYEIEQERRQLAEVLNKVGRSLTSTPNLNNVLNSILVLLKELVDYDRGSILLLRKKDKLEFVAAVGYETDNSPLHYTIPIDTENNEDIFVQIYRTSQPLHLPDVAKTSGWRNISDIPTPGSWLGIPLIRENETIGMFSLARTDLSPYSDDAITMATAFANQAAVAIENARLFRQATEFNNQLEYEVGQRTLAITHAYDQLDRLNQTKSEFINITAHELRTPVTIVKGYAQLIGKNKVITDDEQLTSLAAGIVSGADRMHQIVNTMLLMTKIDNQALEIFSEPLNLGQLINQLAKNLEADLKNRNINLIVDENINTLPAIEGDEEVLLIVFGNILTNAIKYTPDGGQIQVDGFQWKDQPPNPDLPKNGIEIVIRDNGIGIDPESLELIFSKFYQTGDSTYHSSGRTKFKGGGPGLGLAIARGIIEAHRGRLWAESPGKDEMGCPGSSFHIVLPQNTKKRKSFIPAGF